METEQLVIANLNCGGCIHTITQKLTAVAGVESVAVDLATNQVTVSHNQLVSRTKIAEVLLSLGYPETTEENTLGTQIKSITSCIIGKISS